MKKIALSSVAVLLGIEVGALAGGLGAFLWYQHQFRVIRSFAWAEMSLGVSENQFDADATDAKQNLLNTLSTFESGVRSRALDPSMNKAMRMNCGLIEARLSVLDSEAGDADGAKSYLAKAQDDLRAVGWIDYSDANILKAVERQWPHTGR